MPTDIFPAATSHFFTRLANTPVREEPFPHFYSEKVFPKKFYSQLQKLMPDLADYETIASSGRVGTTGKSQCAAHNARYVMDLTQGKVAEFGPEKQAFWSGLLGILHGQAFLQVLFEKFAHTLSGRFGEELPRITFQPEVLLIRDFINYSLGPHTDHPSRALVFILYLPAANDSPELGTSLYVPKERGRTCPGGPIHDYNDFDKVFTAGYAPNTALAFVKTSNSFHGVEPVTVSGHERNLIHIVIRHDSDL